ncbi:MAG: Smr/MutS family protein [Deltaproteobacteria bacterium]|nr:Smr/MutS family protein [Deltaproteobacteria bacterium]
MTRSPDNKNSPRLVDFEPADLALLKEWMSTGRVSPEQKFEGVENSGMSGPSPGPRGSPRRRGKPGQEDPPDAELDLHGKTREQAVRALQSFILTSRRQGLRRVLVITGKGHHSGDEGPVLGRLAAHWLTKNGTPYVWDFQPAPPRLGGDGALVVRLRRLRE